MIGGLRRAGRLALVAVAGCGVKAPAKAVAAPALAVVSPRSAVAAGRAAEAARAPARSHRVAVIARRAIGPFIARDAGGAISAWIASAERGGEQELVVVPLGTDGVPLGEPRKVANVPRESTSLIVRPAGSSRGGWLVAWSALLDRGESLTVVGIAPDGAVRGSPADLRRTSDHIEWTDLVPTTQGAVCVWAEQTPSGDANVLAASLDSDGRPRGMPVRVSRGVRRWQAVPAGDGVGLALVLAATGDPAPPGGTLTWRRLDAQGRAVGTPVSIGSRPTVGSDVDVAPVRDGWLLAWTDRTGEDSQVMVARVDPSGRVDGPKPAMNAVGGSSLVALAAGAESVALAWEEPHARARASRTLHLAMVSTSEGLSAHSVTTLEVASSGSPELVADGRGFALLATSATCPAGPQGAACAARVLPTFVRFDAGLEPVQTEPLFLGDDRIEAAIAWGLRCVDDHCLALAASAEAPTPVFAVDLVPRTSPFSAPARPAQPPDAPRAAGVTTIASGQPYVDIAATRLGAATFVATLTAEPGRDRAHTKGRGATIGLRVVDDDGQSLLAPWTLSSRAVAAGGLAMAPGGSLADGAAVVWVKRHDDDAQVHVARLDRSGRRGAEVQLTATKGEHNSVAIAWAGDGWLVAWVDGRDGNGEVYATKVDRDLRRAAREERITNAPGDAADVALAVRGDVAWLAWSDARESAREGLGDIYVTTLHTRDAKRVADEVRVLSTAPHSRSPEVVPTPDGGAIVAWIEDAAPGLDASAGTSQPPQEQRGRNLVAVMVARLDAAAHVVGSPARLALAGDGDARPTSIALAAAGDGARAVVARSSGDVVSLDAVLLGPDASPVASPWPLLDLDAPPSFDVSLAFAGDALVFADVGAASGDHRVRRAAIRWRR